MKYSSYTLYLLVFILFLGINPSTAQKGLLAQNDQNNPVEKFDELVRIYDVNLIYDVKDISSVKLSKIVIGQSSAESDLSSLLKNTRLEYKKLTEKTFVIKRKGVNNKIASQQAKKIVITEVKGQVLDRETKEALIGVSILKKGTAIGTQSDFDGNFSINLEKGETIVLSYIGYQTTEIVWTDQSSLYVELGKDEKVIDEVVIVGYGTQAKRDLTGAIDQISELEIKQLPNTGLEQALQGRSAGVFVTQNSGAPGGGLSIRIRGTASTGSSEPLYVVDGIPIVNDNQGTSATFERDGGGQYTNALTTINPNDIESIEILKDASATAIYGSRGGNGVVLITTKRGKDGKSILTYDTYVGVQQLYREIPLMNLTQYAQYIAATNGSQQIEELADTTLLGPL